MNLLRLAGQLAPEDSRSVTLSGEHCVHYRDKAHPCRACSDVCPVGAIEWGAPPRLAGDRCQRCLACLPACPTGAITGEDEVPALFRCLAAVRPRRLELLCPLNPRAEQGVPGVDAAIRIRGCLAGLGSAALVLLVAKGLEQVVVRDDACAGCPWQRAGEELAVQIGQARALLALWDLEEQLPRSGPAVENWRPRALYLAHSPPVSRRDLFRPRRSASAAETAPADGHHPFRERLRLVRAVQLLGAPLPEAREVPLAMRGFCLLQAADSCTACGACARICPTGALEIAIDDEGYRLTISPAACTGCEMCLHVCGPGALTKDTSPTYTDIFEGPGMRVLREGPIVRCLRCRVPFPAAAGSEYCAVCDFRRENPFGAFETPGLQPGSSADRVGQESS